MTSLTLRLEKQLGTATSAGAVATLQRVADLNGAAVSGEPRIEATVPANAGGSGNRVDVQPGRWLIEATLPSGEMLSEEVLVPFDQEIPVTFHPAEDSPHEWLDWQYLLGNIEGAETFSHIKDRAQDYAATYVRKKLVKKFDPGFADKIASLGVGAAGVVVGAAADKIANFGVGAALAVSDTIGPALRTLTLGRYKPARDPTFEQWAVQAGAPTVGVCPDLLARSTSGSNAWQEIFKLGAVPSTICDPSVVSKDEALYLYRIEQLLPGTERAFAHIAWGDEAFVVSLPLPWTHIDTHQRVPVELLVRLDPLDRKVSIGVAVLDSEFGTLAGLMTAATLPKARIVVRQARNMLFEKTSNPLAAAAGAYVLLSTASEEDSDEWHDWIDNFDRHFPHIADGAVLKASLRLRFPKNQRSLDEAKEALFDAVNRGVPYYSAGIAWLLEGLTTFATDDERANADMKLVQRIAQRLDLSQAFTVVRTGEPRRQV